MGVANAIIGKRYPIKYFNEDGTRSVEEHAGIVKGMSRLVFKEGDKIKIELNLLLNLEIKLKELQIVQDFFDDRVNYNHLLIGFFKEYIESIYNPDIPVLIISFTSESATFTWKNWYDHKKFIVRLSTKDVIFQREFKETKAKKGVYKKLYNISIAELLLIKHKEILTWSKYWNMESNANSIRCVYKYYYYEFSQFKICLKMSKEFYKYICSSKFLIESDVFKKGELFHLTEKQLTKATKANVFKKTCIISKINLDGTVELEFE